MTTCPIDVGSLVVLKRAQDLGSERIGIVVLVSEEIASVAWSGSQQDECLLRDLMVVTEDNAGEIERRSLDLLIRSP